jgi:hypothetical protein
MCKGIACVLTETVPVMSNKSACYSDPLFIYLFGCLVISLLLFSLALQPSVGHGLLVTRGFVITHNDAPQSVGPLLDE